MSKKNKRKRTRRARINRRLVLIASIAVAVLGIVGLTAWLVFDRLPATTIRHYPMEYQDLILQYAAENDLPPAYVASVILAESSYRPDAVSSADAQGLMQLLPSTAEWIAGKFDEAYVDGCLFDPQTNIRYGCWYLGFLMKRYNGDKRCSSAAYHAGQGTVDKWLMDPECSKDGQTLDVIPYSTTDTYVQRVLKYYEKYEKLYAKLPG